MLKDMLKKLELTAEEFLAPVDQFITNLLGKNGKKWWEDFKKFLRKELIVFHHDLQFDFNWNSCPKPSTMLLDVRLGPDEIYRRLESRRLRMGTTEELISYMSLRAKEEDISVMIFSRFRNTPCAILYSKHGCQFQIRIMHNQETTRWHAECQFLVFPL